MVERTETDKNERARQRRRRSLSSVIDWFIIVQGASAALFTILSIAWLISGVFLPAEHANPLTTVIVIVCLLPIVLVAVHRRREITEGRATSRLKALWGIASGLSIVAAFIFFGTLVPDIVLAFQAL